MFTGLEVMDFCSNSQCALFDKRFVVEASELKRVIGCGERVASIEIRQDQRMRVGLSAKEATMNNDVSALGAAMMADERHVASEKAVFCEPSVYALSSEISIWFVGRLYHTGRAK